MEPEYLTPYEVSERLRIKKATLANWRNHRRGPPFQKFGFKVLYRIEDLVAWELQQRVETSERIDPLA